MSTDEKWSGSAYSGPSGSPGFRLWRQFLDWQRQLNALLKPLGLTQPQFAILAVCGWLTRDGEQITQNGIAHFTGMDRMHISQIVSRLEKDGLVVRSRSDGDGRAAFASITEAGRAQRKKMWKIYEGAVDELFLSQFDDQQQRFFSDALERAASAARSCSAPCPRRPITTKRSPARETAG